MYVDKWERNKNTAAEFVPCVFYGQLRSIYRVFFSSAYRPLDIAEGTEIWMAEIKSCKLLNNPIPGLDSIQLYQGFGQTHCADITCIDGLVG